MRSASPARAIATRTPRRRASATASSRYGLRRAETRIEDEPDVEPADHVARAADVVALRVREDEQREPAQPAPAELLGRPTLRRPLVDEHRRPGRLHEDRVALPDVERRDAKPRRRRHRLPRRNEPPEPDADDRRRGCRQHRQTRSRGEPCGREHAATDEREEQQRRPRPDLRERERRDEPRDRGEIRREPAVGAGRELRDLRDDRVERGCDEAEDEDRTGDGPREHVRGHRPHRYGAEVRPEDRRRDEAARSGDGDHGREPRRDGIALRPLRAHAGRQGRSRGRRRTTAGTPARAASSGSMPGARSRRRAGSATGPAGARAATRARRGSRRHRRARPRAASRPRRRSRGSRRARGRVRSGARRRRRSPARWRPRRRRRRSSRRRPAGGRGRRRETRRRARRRAPGPRRARFRRRPRRARPSARARSTRPGPHAAGRPRPRRRRAVPRAASVRLGRRRARPAARASRAR